MREFKGYQLRQTHEQFEKILQEAGIKADGLEVKSHGGSQHLIRLDGKFIGFYRYESGKLMAAGGYTYEWKKELLTYPDDSTKSVPFAEALRVIILHK